MRPTKFTEVKVGAFVVIILLLFAVVIFTIGSHQRYFQRQYTLWASFSNIKGLLIGSPVRLAGLTVGRVGAIYFAGEIGEKAITVEMKIEKEAQGRIREDSVANIQTMGLLGDKYVEITMGSPDKEILPDQAHIRSIDPIDLFAYMTKVEEAIDVINTILLDIKEISTQIKSGRGLAHAVLYDPAGEELVRNLSVASGSADELMKDLSSTAKSLKNIVEKVERGEGSLGALINDPTAYEDLKVILGGAKKSKTIKALIRYTIKKKKEEGGGGEGGR